MADATPAQVAGAQNLLVIASTWGEGDPPQRAIDFHAALMADDAPRFEGVRYAVLALGDRAYAKFCETGRLFDERFAALGGDAGRRPDRVRPRLRGAGQRLDRRHAGQLQAELGEPEAGAAVIHVDFARARGGAPRPTAARGRSRRRSPSASGSPAAGPRPTPGIWSCRSTGPASPTSRAIRWASCRRTIRRWSMRCWRRRAWPAMRHCVRRCRSSSTSPR